MKNFSYLALLRGINVGGNNIIKMSDLKLCFESMGFTNVMTYIQSGNVIFQTPEKNVEDITTKIEKTLSKQFNYAARVVVVSQGILNESVEKAPKGFGSGPTKYRYDVIFLKNPMTAKEAMESVRIKEGVDTAIAGVHVLYFSRLITRATQSYLSKIIQSPVYQSMTIRNWNTTTKLQKLLESL